MTDAPVLSIRGATKRYSRSVLALNDVSLDVPRGAVFGLLGPNGAGKSTLVKILMTIVRPTAITGSMLGNPIGDKGTLRRIGYLAEHHRLPKYLTATQAVRFAAAMHGMNGAEAKRRTAELLDKVGMTVAADRKIGTYSKGMQQRTGLAAALVNDPELVFLDEPTDGVDPEGRMEIRALLKAMKDAGKTVFFNSHMLSEVEGVADSVVIMVGGQVASAGNIQTLTAGKERYEIAYLPAAGQPTWAHQVLDLGWRPLPAPAPIVGMPLPPASFLGRLPGSGIDVIASDTRFSVTTSNPVAIAPIIQALSAKGLVLTHVNLKRPTLEDLFMEVVAARRAANLGGTR